MGRLTQLPTRLTSPAKRLKEPEAAAPLIHRDNAPWRRLYNTARWRALRWATLERDNFTCRMCGRLQGDTSQLVCDHKRPHRGNLTLFWDEANLQAVCKPCHDGAKQRLEQGSRHTIGVWD